MPRQVRYKPHPFLQLVVTALDELIEAQSGLLMEYYLPASEKWEMPQDAFEDLLASTPVIQGCDDWDVETFWTAVIEAENRCTPLLWLQRSTTHTRGEHLMVTFSKPTPVGGLAARKRRLTEAGAAHDIAQRQ